MIIRANFFAVEYFEYVFGDERALILLFIVAPQVLTYCHWGGGGGGGGGAVVI